MKSTILMSAILATVSVSAEITGEWGRRMYGGSPFGKLLGLIFFVGLILLVWLWVLKLWTELRQKKKKR